MKKAHKSLTSDVLVAWLREHPLISVRGLERECGLPNDVIRKAMEGRQKVADKHLPVIVKHLKGYGY